MIGAGCGAAGCLGLIVVAFAGFGVYWYNRTPPRHESNINISLDRNANRNSNTNTNSNTNSAPTQLSTADENRHRLYQAAAATSDSELNKKVSQKLGLVDSQGMPNSQYSEFLKAHFKWIFHNTDWIQTINTPEKARAYVDEHIDD
jgi:hypothetical protein